MKTPPEQEIAQAVSEIPWLSRCGEPLEIDLSLSIDLLSSWASAKASISRQRWTNTTLEAYNDLGEESRKRGKDVSWNSTVEIYKAAFEPVLRERLVGLAESLELGDRLLHDVQWNVLGWSMEKYFLGRKNGFFEQLFLVYRAGHLPCGWEGNWPRGSLRVF